MLANQLMSELQQFDEIMDQFGGKEDHLDAKVFREPTSHVQQPGQVQQLVSLVHVKHIPQID